jgi:hypothetical protein
MITLFTLPAMGLSPVFELTHAIGQQPGRKQGIPGLAAPGAGLLPVAWREVPPTSFAPVKPAPVFRQPADGLAGQLLQPRPSAMAA